MRRAHVAALVGGALALLAGPRPITAPLAPAEAAKPRKSARSCVRYTQTMTKDKGGVILRWTNRCNLALSCEVSWTARCDDEDGTPGGQAVSLEARGSSELTVSPVCEGGWEVADVRWSCEGG